MSTQGLLLATLALTGCGASCDQRYDARHPGPAELEDAVTQFAQARGRAVRVPVLLLNPPEFETHGGGQGTVGLCQVDTHGPVVLLNSDYWYHADSAERWALVWHELGHCVLGREHRNDFALACPASIMNWSVTPVGRCVRDGSRNALDYANELFSAPSGASN